MIANIWFAAVFLYCFGGVVVYALTFFGPAPEVDEDESVSGPPLPFLRGQVPAESLPRLRILRRILLRLMLAFALGFASIATTDPHTRRWVYVTVASAASAAGAGGVVWGVARTEGGYKGVARSIAVCVRAGYRRPVEQQAAILFLGSLLLLFGLGLAARGLLG